MANQQTILEHFEFVESTHSKHLHCKLCSELMLEPIRLHRCGHTLCKKCVDLKQVKKCPLCLEKIKAKQKDILASRLVGELAVKCLHEGCPWTGTLMQFRSFHRQGCKLKEGGMDEWLKKLQQSISISRKPEKTYGKMSQKPIQENEHQYKNYEQQQQNDSHIIKQIKDVQNSRDVIENDEKKYRLPSTQKKSSPVELSQFIISKNWRKNIDEDYY